MGIERLEMIELGDLAIEHRTLHVIDARFHLRDPGLQGRAIDVLDRDGDVGQYSQAIRADLGESAEHNKPGLLACRIDRHEARPQQGDQRRVTGQYAEVALGAGHIDLIDLAGKRDLVRRYEFEMERGHA